MNPFFLFHFNFFFLLNHLLIFFICEFFIETSGLFDQKSIVIGYANECNSEIGNFGLMFGSLEEMFKKFQVNAVIQTTEFT